ncbi:precorrin 6A synthase, putative [Babesia caballi]|uniref:Precorrin 6A synthase, putative n=1 Tax=Babesia caballi TaxID=5871 RepID=A0AAV4LN88_BABCB|nr:precorrin 6A synthase, putative [Babesia caballi]
MEPRAVHRTQKAIMDAASGIRMVDCVQKPANNRARGRRRRTDGPGEEVDDVGVNPGVQRGHDDGRHHRAPERALSQVADLEGVAQGACGTSHRLPREPTLNHLLLLDRPQQVEVGQNPRDDAVKCDESDVHRDHPDGNVPLGHVQVLPDDVARVRRRADAPGGHVLQDAPVLENVQDNVRVGEGDEAYARRGRVRPIGLLPDEHLQLLDALQQVGEALPEVLRVVGLLLRRQRRAAAAKDASDVLGDAALQRLGGLCGFLVRVRGQRQQVARGQAAATQPRRGVAKLPGDVQVPARPRPTGPRLRNGGLPPAGDHYAPVDRLRRSGPAHRGGAPLLLAVPVHDNRHVAAQAELRLGGPQLLLERHALAVVVHNVDRQDVLREVPLEVPVEKSGIGDGLVEAADHDGVQLRAQQDGDLLALVDALPELEDVHVHNERVDPGGGVERPDGDLAAAQLVEGVHEELVRLVVDGEVGEDHEVGDERDRGDNQKHDARAAHEFQIQHRLVVPDAVALAVEQVVPPGVLVGLLARRGLANADGEARHLPGRNVQGARRGRLGAVPHDIAAEGVLRVVLDVCTCRELAGSRRARAARQRAPTIARGIEAALELHLVNRLRRVLRLCVLAASLAVQLEQPLEAFVDDVDDAVAHPAPDDHAGDEHHDVQRDDDDEVPHGALHRSDGRCDTRQQAAGSAATRGRGELIRDV